MSDTKDERAARSAAALRENLKRRKARVRATQPRSDAAGPESPPDPHTTDEEAARGAEG